MYLTQANAKLWFGILALLASSCGSNGECDFAPERCVPREVRLNLTIMERSIGGDLSVSFDGEHRQSGNLVVELLPLKDGVVVADSAQELSNVTPPANMVTMNIASNTLNTGTYQVRVRQIDHELTIPEKRPVLKVTGTQIQWQQVNPVAFALPEEIVGRIDCDIASRNIKLGGVWTGGPPSSSSSLAEIIVSRDYMNCDPAQRTQFLKTGGLTIREFDGGSLLAPSFLDVWRFPGVELQSIQAVRKSTGDYRLIGVSLQNQSSAKDLGQLATAAFDHMALAVSDRVQTLLVSSGQTLSQYKLQEKMTPMKADVKMWPGDNAKISSIIGYAATTTSMLATGVGFLLIDANGVPYRLRIENGSIAYDGAGTEFLQNGMRNDKIAPLALAAGDLNDDGLTDLAVLRSNKTVSFYVQRMDGSFYLASSMLIPEAIKQPSAIAIGQVDGQGFSDLLIGDSQPQACGQTFCNMVHVFLNASTVVQ